MSDTMVYSSRDPPLEMAWLDTPDEKPPKSEFRRMWPGRLYHVMFFSETVQCALAFIHVEILNKKNNLLESLPIQTHEDIVSMSRTRSRCTCQKWLLWVVR